MYILITYTDFPDANTTKNVPSMSKPHTFVLRPETTDSSHTPLEGTHRLAALAKHRAPKGGLTLGLSEGISSRSEALPLPLASDPRYALSERRAHRWPASEISMLLDQSFD